MFWPAHPDIQELRWVLRRAHRLHRVERGVTRIALGAIAGGPAG